jgi:BirA family biotin operon repressor/biotin-[acetyl-CoA-carboxylase] ligase
MPSEHSVAAAALAAGLAGEAWYRGEVGSTNTELIALARDGAPAWSVLVAGFQRAGRGRLGRTWTAPPGSSLMASLLLRPTLAPADAPLIALAGGACLAEAVEAVTGVVTRCKWPNDVLAGGRKVAGVLTESEVEADGERVAFVVVGTGVNVSQSAEDFPPEARSSATSVALEGGAADADGLLAAYLAAFRSAFDPDADGFAARTLASYRERCATIGRRVSATTTSGERVEGVAAAVGDRGQLVVETEWGRAEVAFGEVEHLR